MRNVTSLGVAVRGWNDLKIVEVLSPIIRYRTGVVEISLEEILNLGGVAAEQIRVRLKCFHHNHSPLLDESLVEDGQTRTAR